MCKCHTPCIIHASYVQRDHPNHMAMQSTHTALAAESRCRAASYLLNAAAHSRVANVGVDLGQEATTCGGKGWWKRPKPLNEHDTVRST